MPEETPQLDNMKEIVIRRIIRNYTRHRLDTLCLAFGRLPEQLDEHIWLTAEYQKWAGNEWLSEEELERLLAFLPVEGLLDCLEGQSMMLHRAASLPEAPPKMPPQKNRGALIIPFPLARRRQQG